MDSEQRIAELEKRIAQLEEEAEEPDGLSRRDAMKLGGAGIAGALMGGGGSMAAVDRASAGTDQSGTIGTATDPVDVIAEDVESETVATEYATTELNTIYVRPTGDDTNSGIEDTDPLATVQEGVLRLLVASQSNTPTVDIGGGTYNERVVVDMTQPFGRIEIVGDGSAIIDGSGLTSAMAVYDKTHLKIEGVDTIGGTDSALSAAVNSTIDIVDGTHDINGATNGMYIINGSGILTDSTASITNNAAGAEDMFKVLGESWGVLSAPMTGNGDEGAIVNTGETSRSVIDGDIDGQGATDGFAARSGSTVEVVNNSVTNVTVGGRSTASHLNLKDTITFGAGLSATYVRNDGGTVSDQAATRGTEYDGPILNSQDLGAADASTPEIKTICYHIGTDPGLYRADPGNSQWNKVEDNTVTIAY